MEEKSTDTKYKTAFVSQNPSAWDCWIWESIQHIRAHPCDPFPRQLLLARANIDAPWVWPRAVTSSSDIPSFSSTNEWLPLLNTKTYFRPLHPKPSQIKNMLLLLLSCRQDCYRTRLLEEVLMLFSMGKSHLLGGALFYEGCTAVWWTTEFLNLITAFR